ncbi:MAG TPA: rod shape-determining protein MreC [Bacteroidales bacterium]|nr:rod shape-determining protein MreC [Bacteroidales bacterium]
MRDLLRFIVRNYFVMLFLLFEGISFVLIVQFNAFQRSRFMGLSRTVTGTVYKDLEGFREYLHLRTENEALVAENARLRNKLDRNAETIYVFPGDSTGSDTIHEYSGTQDYFYIPARVVNNSVNRQYNYMTIDKGARQGLRNDMGVISERGVVGIVDDVSENYATIIPVLNRNFRLSARIFRNNYFGIIEWDGRNPELVRLREIPSHVRVIPGDTVVTSGFSAIFPPNLNIGVVKSVKTGDGNFYDIVVRLSANFRNIYHVNVISNFNREEQKDLEDESQAND